MRQFILKHFVVFILVGLGTTLFAQNPSKATSKKYPASFTITNAELDQIFTQKTNSIIQSKSNIYLNNAKVLLNSSYKENKQLKLKLSYFKNAELFVQVNGKDSKIVYILSSDNSVFYNGVIDQKQITLKQCKKDDIFSE